MSGPPQATHASRLSSPPEPATVDAPGQLLFQNLNEEIHRIAESFGVDDTLELVCECERGNCFVRLSVALQQYEAIRRFPNRFLLRADHVGREERIVEEATGYVVVEKTGAGAQSATLLDPRRRPTGAPVS